MRPGALDFYPRLLHQHSRRVELLRTDEQHERERRGLPSLLPVCYRSLPLDKTLRVGHARVPSAEPFQRSGHDFAAFLHGVPAATGREIQRSSDSGVLQREKRGKFLQERVSVLSESVQPFSRVLEL